MKKKENGMSHWLSFRLDDELYNKIALMAEKTGKSKAECIRTMIDKGKVTVRQEIIADVPQLKQVIAQLGKIGSNINQIAHYYNGGGARSREMYEKTQQALADVFQMKYEIEKMGGEFRGYSQASHRKKQ